MGLLNKIPATLVKICHPQHGDMAVEGVIFFFLFSPLFPVCLLDPGVLGRLTKLLILLNGTVRDSRFSH